MKYLVFLLSIPLFAGCTEKYDLPTGRQPNLPAQASIVKSSGAGAAEVNSVSEPNGVLTLRQALVLTLMENPELKAFSFETRAAEARELQAGLWPNPTLDITVEDVGGSGPRSDFDGAETTIGVSQLIELGNKSQKRQHVASLEKELAGWDYEAKRREVLTRAGKAYIELLAMQKKAALLAELVAVSEQTAQSVAHRVEAGKDSPVEKTKAAIALSAVRLEHQQTQQSLETARRLLASFWGSQQPVFTLAQGQLETVSDIADMAELRSKLVQHPQAARRQKEIDRSQAALELAKSKAISDVSIGVGVKRFNESDDNALVFGVGIPLPISDRNQGGAMEAAYALSKTYQEQRAAHLELLNQFNQVYAELSASRNKIKTLQDSILPAAAEVFDASRTAYTEGKIDYLNMLDAQRTYFVTQTDYLETLVLYHQAKTDMEGLIGQSIDKTDSTQQQ